MFIAENILPIICITSCSLLGGEGEQKNHRVLKLKNVLGFVNTVCGKNDSLLISNLSEFSRI